jgi:quinol monooxygenase YgiN
MYTLTVHLHCNEDPESIVRLKAKLVEAARVYRKDKETADWLVMQDVHDPRSFTVVERFENESVSYLLFIILNLNGQIFRIMPISN